MGRVILNLSKPSISFPNGDRETGLICLSGKATVKAAGQDLVLGKFDAIYIPRDSSVEISTSNSGTSLNSLPRSGAKYPLKLVRYADVEKDPRLKFVTGGRRFIARIEHAHRASNVEAGRPRGRFHLLRSRKLDELAAS